MKPKVGEVWSEEYVVDDYNSIMMYYVCIDDDSNMIRLDSDTLSFSANNIRARFSEMFCPQKTDIEMVLVRSEPSLKFIHRDKHGPGETLYPKEHTYAGRLSNDNPLADMPFWNAPNGKNLTILASLEWSLIHLQAEHEKLPCPENEWTINHLKECIHQQRERSRRRIEQDLIGTMIPHKYENEI